MAKSQIRIFFFFFIIYKKLKKAPFALNKKAQKSALKARFCEGASLQREKTPRALRSALKRTFNNTAWNTSSRLTNWVTKVVVTVSFSIFSRFIIVSRIIMPVSSHLLSQGSKLLPQQLHSLLQCHMGFSFLVGLWLLPGMNLLLRLMCCRTFLVPSIINYWCHLHKFLGSLVEDKKNEIKIES